MELVLVHQSVERGSIDACQPRGLGHVAAGPAHQASQVLFFELRHYAVLRGMVRLVHNSDGHKIFGRPIGTVIIHRNVVRLDHLVRLGQHGHVLDHVLQFSNVASPGP